MTGLILIPKKYNNSFITAGRYYSIFNKIKDRLGFNIRVTNSLNIKDIKEDVVLIFKSPQKDSINMFSNLVDLPANKKLIGFYTDLHSRGDLSISGHGGEDRKFDKAIYNMMDRCDLILCPYDFAFRKKFSVFLNKYVNFPQFINNNHFSNIPFNNNPKMTCLLTGCGAKCAYPLRHQIILSRNPNIVRLEHPGYLTKTKKVKKMKNIKIGLQYAEELNKYFCGIATSSILDYVVAKYMEIPASGSLLLADYTPDLDLFGFEDGKHYVKIDKHNYAEKILYVLNNPNEYK